MIWERFKFAVNACYGWKNPMLVIKNGEFSIFLNLIALHAFLSRLFWPSQFIKLVSRLYTGNKHVHPLIKELYEIMSIVAEAVVLVCLYYDPKLDADKSSLVALLLAVKLYETISSSIYYLLLRPVLDPEPPYDIYTSFVSALLAFVETYLILCLIWYYKGVVCPKFASIVDCMYFVGATFFTVGYGDYSPKGQDSKLLAIVTMFVSITVIAVILTRALALVKPLPTNDD